MLSFKDLQDSAWCAGVDVESEMGDGWEKVLRRCVGREEERGMEEGESSCSKGVETHLLCCLK